MQYFYLQNKNTLGLIFYNKFFLFIKKEYINF